MNAKPNRRTKQGELALRLADELARSYREHVELRTFVSRNLDRTES